MKKIDVCGLNCPEPVIRVKSVMDAGEKDIEVLCDQAVAKENISRLCKKMKYKIVVFSEGDNYILKISKY